MVDSTHLELHQEQMLYTCKIFLSKQFFEIWHFLLIFKKFYLDVSYSLLCCKISIAADEKSQPYTNNSGSLLYSNMGNIVFPTPHPISKILCADCIWVSSLLSFDSGKTLNGLSLSSLTSFGASSGNSVNSQCLSLKNLKHKRAN